MTVGMFNLVFNTAADRLVWQLDRELIENGISHLMISLAGVKRSGSLVLFKIGLSLSLLLSHTSKLPITCSAVTSSTSHWQSDSAPESAVSYPQLESVSSES